MSTDTLATGTTSEKTVPVRAHGTVVKRLGHWTAMCSREYLADAQRARRAGRYPTIDDPSR